MGRAIKSLMAIAALAGVVAFSSGAMAQTTAAPAENAAPTADNAVLLTIFLKHDQSRPLGEASECRGSLPQPQRLDDLVGSGRVAGRQQRVDQEWLRRCRGGLRIGGSVHLPTLSASARPIRPGGPARPGPRG